MPMWCAISVGALDRLEDQGPSAAVKFANERDEEKQPLKRW
jgi:hypothetical protein